jgi:hypothetical protein
MCMLILLLMMRRHNASHARGGVSCDSCPVSTARQLPVTFDGVVWWNVPEDAVPDARWEFRESTMGEKRGTGQDTGARIEGGGRG